MATLNEAIRYTDIILQNSVLYFVGFAKGRAKSFLLITNVSAGNRLSANHGLGGPSLTF